MTKTAKKSRRLNQWQCLLIEDLLTKHLVKVTEDNAQGIYRAHVSELLELVVQGHAITVTTKN